MRRPLAVLGEAMMFGLGWDLAGGILYVAALAVIERSTTGLFSAGSLLIGVVVAAAPVGVFVVWLVYLVVSRITPSPRGPTSTAGAAVVVVVFLSIFVVTDSMRWGVVLTMLPFMVWGALGAWFGARWVLD